MLQVKIQDPIVVFAVYEPFISPGNVLVTVVLPGSPVKDWVFVPFGPVRETVNSDAIPISVVFLIITLTEPAFLRQEEEGRLSEVISKEPLHEF